MSRLIRKTDTFLLEWKNKTDRLPLIVKGARQIGKTEAISHFARGNYKSVPALDKTPREMLELLDCNTKD